MLDWTLEDLAARSGLTSQTLYRFERGITRPHPATVVTICRTLEAAGVQFAEVEGGTGVFLARPAAASDPEVNGEA